VEAGEARRKAQTSLAKRGWPPGSLGPFPTSRVCRFESFDSNSTRESNRIESFSPWIFNRRTHKKKIRFRWRVSHEGLVSPQVGVRCCGCGCIARSGLASNETTIH